MYTYQPTSWKDQAYLALSFLVMLFLVPLMLIYVGAVWLYIHALAFFREFASKR